MNSNSSTIRRAIAATAAIAAIFTTAACGTEQAPATNISGSHTKQERKAPPQPARTTERRIDFGDEIGTADHREKKPSPAGSGTRNRMDFRDKGW